MATLLRRLSVSLDKRGSLREQEGSTPSSAPASGFASSGPFGSVSASTVQDVISPREGMGDGSRASFAVGSAPTSAYMPTALSGIASRVAPLRIPTSVSGLKGVDSPSATPRSALVAPQLSVGSPLSVAVPSAEGTGELPSSPRSPQSPGGRRRRSPKIDGLDYYEFCELLRSSSL